MSLFGSRLRQCHKEIYSFMTLTEGAKLDPMRIVLSGSVCLVARFLEVLPFSLSPSYN